MPQTTELKAARAILGNEVVGAEEVQSVLGPAYRADAARAATVPFPARELERARDLGFLLIHRVAAVGTAPVTLQWLIRKFPAAFDPQLLQKMGYALKGEWGIELDPVAEQEVCCGDWALVQRTPLADSLNRTFDDQTDALRQFAGRHGWDGRTRRRTAIEIAFDLVVFWQVRGERLLPNCWDWSSTRAVDGGLINTGNFTDRGMQVLAYSQGIRHGTLGVCANIDPPQS